MFRVGQKVVCVDSSAAGGRWHSTDKPELGSVYTVTKSFIDEDGYRTLHFAEIQRTEAACAHWGRPDLGYNTRRFRPIVSNSKKSEREKIINKLLTDGLNQDLEVM